jgi:single-stranded DNA-specific DHH superfamily exonuclease
MERLEFIFGSEERFTEFFKNLGNGKNTALLTHTDLDGLVAGKIASLFVKADVLDFVDYKDLNEGLIEKLKKQKVEHLVLTDLAVTKDFVSKAEKEFEILIIDHHVFPEDLNSERTVFLNAEGFCAAYLCYCLFSALSPMNSSFPRRPSAHPPPNATMLSSASNVASSPIGDTKIKNLENYDWLVACACIADWAYRENQEFMKKVFKKYGDEFVIEKKTDLIRNSGFFWDLNWKLSLAAIYCEKDLKKVFDSINDIEQTKKLDKYSGNVQEEIDSAIEKFEKEKIQIRGGYFCEFSPRFKIGHIISSEVSKNHWHETIVILQPNKNTFGISVRHQDGSRDMVEFVQKLVGGFENSSGGGHFKASGGHVMLKDREKLIEKLKKL